MNRVMCRSLLLLLVVGYPSLFSGRGGCGHRGHCLLLLFTLQACLEWDRRAASVSRCAFEERLVFSPWKLAGLSSLKVLRESKDQCNYLDV